MNNQQFFALLFDDNQATSFAKHKKGTKVYPVAAHDQYTWANLFTINALHPSQDMKPTEEYHSADKPRRADHNVVCYRNILVEMDHIPLQEQANYVKEVGLPYSTAVYSGGKSIHFIISLETPFATEAEYRFITTRVFKALKGNVDSACKNPSRFSRFPGALRHDADDKKQTLISIKARIPNATLIAWIDSILGKDFIQEEIRAEEEMRKIREENKYKYDHPTGAPGAIRPLNGFTLNFLMMGAAEGERNPTVFRAGCDFAKCGYDMDEAIDRISAATDLPYREVCQTVKSAYKRVENDQD